jgi:indolepyruvate ferredoxin oxidoreductase
LNDILGGTKCARELSDIDKLEAVIDRSSQHLTAYQDAGYAQYYRDFVDQVRRAEREALPPGVPLELTRQVALNYARLLACKDEYEVARLYTNGSLERALGEQFTGDYAVHYHFLPEYLAKNGLTGRNTAKREFGPMAGTWLKLLARLRVLRGTSFDLFSRSSARRDECALANDYRVMMGEMAASLNTRNYAAAIELAMLPEKVRGFGSVRSIAAAHMRSRAKVIMADAVALAQRG